MVAKGGIPVGRAFSLRLGSVRIVLAQDAL
jgi:hypothetical protein